jgi:hypothetical protein
MGELSAVLNGVGAVGVAIGYTGLLFWMLATGRLCTGRELRDKNGRVQALEKMVTTRDEQINLMLRETLPTVSSVLSALHEAAGEPKP